MSTYESADEIILAAIDRPCPRWDQEPAHLTEAERLFYEGLGVRSAAMCDTYSVMSEAWNTDESLGLQLIAIIADNEDDRRFFTFYILTMLEGAGGPGWCEGTPDGTFTGDIPYVYGPTWLLFATPYQNSSPSAADPVVGWLQPVAETLGGTAHMVPCERVAALMNGEFDDDDDGVIARRFLDE